MDDKVIVTYNHQTHQNGLKNNHLDVNHHCHTHIIEMPQLSPRGQGENDTHSSSSSHSSDTPKSWCSQKAQIVLALAGVAACTTVTSALISATVSLITHFIK
jgi:hypothetical protein